MEVEFKYGVHDLYNAEWLKVSRSAEGLAADLRRFANENPGVDNLPCRLHFNLFGIDEYPRRIQKDLIFDSQLIRDSSFDEVVKMINDQMTFDHDEAWRMVPLPKLIQEK